MSSQSPESKHRGEQEAAHGTGSSDQYARTVDDISVAEDEFIEGGDIKNLDETSVRYFNREKHEANTACRLAYLFVGTLAGFLVLHYTATLLAALWLEPEIQDFLQNIFHAGLPVLSGLAGAAATYFFIRRD